MINDKYLIKRADYYYAKFLPKPESMCWFSPALRAGVKVDLIVCGMRPCVEGISDNIQPPSIISRFLEHTRVFYFHNNGEPVRWCSCADWMERNVFKHVEIAFPTETQEYRLVIINARKFYLHDNGLSSLLREDGTYLSALEICQQHCLRNSVDPDRHELAICHTAQLALLKTVTVIVD